VDENGRKFYAECTDYDESQVDDWIRENVIANLRLVPGQCGQNRKTKVFEVCGTKDVVARCLKNWLTGKSVHTNFFQMFSDVAHYDFVLFIDLFGTAFDLPPWQISPTCHDINQDIARHLGISEAEAFDISREGLAGLDPEDGAKHNALWDAEIIKEIHDMISAKGPDAIRIGSDFDVTDTVSGLCIKAMKSKNSHGQNVLRIKHLPTAGISRNRDFFFLQNGKFDGTGCCVVDTEE
jgi:hypothetical protein